MKRSILLLVVLILFGCRGQSPPAGDPFLMGPTRVPPPGTGAVSGRPADPYGQLAPQPAVPQPTLPQHWPSGNTVPFHGTPQPSLPRPGFTSNARPENSRPDSRQMAGSFGFESYDRSGWTSRVPPPSFAARAPNRSPAPQATPVSQSTNLPEKRVPVVRVLQPRPTATPKERQKFNTSPAVPKGHGPVDIMDLPKARDSARQSATPSAQADSGFRLVSGTEEIGPSESPEAESVEGSSSRYGHDPQYAWLRGQLEYSRIEGHWKLRYIPVDGETDKHGGSVVVSDPSVLAGCERGDFVEVRGRVGDRRTKKGYAPTYEVAQIKRLGRPQR